MDDRRPKLHGRRKGRPLSPARQALVDRRLPELLIDTDQAAPKTLDRLFSSDVRTFRLEIGCGGGEHLVHQASGAPDVGFIGVEPFEEGLAKMVAAVDERQLTNVRLYDDDAALLLDWLPAGSLGRVDLLYPDPWPKRRHWKRRFISAENLDRISRALHTGGELRVATDITDYADWTLLHLLPREDFEWTARRADDWRLPWQGWPGTRYEAKARRAGRSSTYLIFRRR